ncbi:FG-GAP-like repeat-containing protein [Rhodopirellula sp. MGV]|uniref:FG-GAP-like repeat-containing protein n=1 Tax=Rhodopirellula sp. MGV TaxID=2023130 RepID=UPI000BD4C49E|nr:FG-GAP-like repeat-containing protein [Rhodopirellula sp. MGV]OYP29464.1 hypothetical protein CGZ80_25030 [Rhodopirellula sp. MGV]
MLLAFALVGCTSSNENAPSSINANSTPDDPVAALNEAIEHREWQTALRRSNDALIAAPGNPDVLTSIAIANGQLGNETKAADLLVQAVEAANFDTKGERIQHAIQALIAQGRLYDAIDLLDKVVEANPQAHALRRTLVGFLGEAQRNEELPVHMNELIRARQFDLMLLMATTETSFRRFSSSTIDQLLQRNPSDLRPLLGQAQTLLESRDVAGAESILRRIVAKHTEFAAGHALLGQAIAAQGKTDDLPRWQSELPPQATEYSGYWTAMGVWSMDRKQVPQAIRCYAQATRLAPNNSYAWSRLADALASLDDGLDESERKLISNAIADRREALLQLRERFANFTDGNQQSQSGATQIAQSLMRLGRNWEAEAWLAIATTLPQSPSDSLTGLRQQVLDKLSDDQAWQSLREHPELAFEIDQFPLPAASAGSLEIGRSAPFAPLASPINLRDQAEQWGLAFYGEVGGQVHGPKVPIHQTLGCGGGVFDFDNDGRPDVVFTAAGGSLGLRDSQPGELFRNLGGEFQSCGSVSRLSDTGFSTGVAIGDINDDGFDDVLVLNLGPNRLFVNNGDGTFQDANDLIEHSEIAQWSSSAAIADIDQDGFNDLFVVNYCDQSEPLDQPCFDAQGNEINCYPLRFRAANDHCFRGTATGSFEDVSKTWIRPATPGRGLGIISGRLDGQHLSTYVVNDASLNHHYRWNDDQRPPMSENGISSGLAVDAQSLDQGSMGIASWDFDHDGDLDFYVTGFVGEYNILYEQKSPGLWADSTASAQLIEPTRSKVAFGTEAIDLDNDGYEELLVSNGHIGDFGDRTSPYAQPFQVFRQSAPAKWDTIDNETLGGYFQRPHTGRALFSLDANSDGRTDFIVTHATEPVSLVINESRNANRQVTFRLVDTKQTRDAVGAKLDFQIGSTPDHRTLFRLAGGGYLCSNQAILVAGVGTASEISNITVTWPDGEIQHLGTLATSAEYLIVRDQAATTLNRFTHPVTNK